MSAKKTSAKKIAKKYDAIIIGSGQGGNPLAKAMAEAGWKVALVEKGDIGGTCVNVGCTPTKTMIASARVAYLAGRGKEYGVLTGRLNVDMKTVRERKRAIVDESRSGSEKGLAVQKNIDVLHGHGRFTDAKTVEVALNVGGTSAITAKKIIIDTGARPSVPEIAGLKSVPFLDNVSIMELDAVPKHLLVLGGGYLALEFGQMFLRLGSAVTIVQHGASIAEHEDPDIEEELTKILREDGLEILTDATATKAAKTKTGIALTIKTKFGTKTLTGSHLLVATGRAPNTEYLGLAAAGVKMDERGHVKVNSRLETNVPGIYAVGDVNGGPAFTHISYDDFRILRTNLLKRSKASTKGRLTNYTMFTDPELGRIGVSETEARKAKKKILVAKMPMAHMARALEMAESRGFIKAIVDAKTKRILGAACLGVDGGEMAALLGVAMMGNLTYMQLRDAVFAHPTKAEALNNLFGSLK